jgi:sulfate/thiosulfate transport system ATP-binding protein
LVATPFVMSFIGPVNILPSNVGIQPNKGIVNANDKVFLRPHDVLIFKDAVEDTVTATVNRIIHLGWEIRVELLLKSGEVVNAHFTREVFDQLQIKESQRVYVKPKQAKVFQTVM